jgi:hypothetical protein
MALHKKSTASANQKVFKPYLTATLKDKNGAVLSTTKECLYDSGANITVIDWDNIKNSGGDFGVAKGGKVSHKGSTHDALKLTGGSLTFGVQPAGGGTESDVQCDTPIYTYPSGSNVVGNDQRGLLGLDITIWDSVNGVGHIEQK